jgi:hypothetical protein
LPGARRANVGQRAGFFCSLSLFTATVHALEELPEMAEAFAFGHHELSKRHLPVPKETRSLAFIFSIIPK